MLLSARLERAVRENVGGDDVVDQLVFFLLLREGE